MTQYYIITENKKMDPHNHLTQMMCVRRTLFLYKEKWNKRRIKFCPLCTFWYIIRTSILIII